MWPMIAQVSLHGTNHCTMPDQTLPILQCLVYIGDIEKLFEDGKRSVLLLVPIRLGSDVFNRIYIPCVKVESC